MTHNSVTVLDLWISLGVSTEDLVEVKTSSLPRFLYLFLCHFSMECRFG